MAFPTLLSQLDGTDTLAPMLWGEVRISIETRLDPDMKRTEIPIGLEAVSTALEPCIEVATGTTRCANRKFEHSPTWASSVSYRRTISFDSAATAIARKWRASFNNLPSPLHFAPGTHLRGDQLARVRDARASVERSVVRGRTDTSVEALGKG